MIIEGIKFGYQYNGVYGIIGTLPIDTTITTAFLQGQEADELADELDNCPIPEMVDYLLEQYL